MAIRPIAAAGKDRSCADRIQRDNLSARAGGVTCVDRENVTTKREDAMGRSMLASLALSLAMVAATVAQAGAQYDVGGQIAPTGKLRVGVLMLSYFAVEDGGTLKGWSPDLGAELARRVGLPHELVPIHNPADMIDAFKTGRIDVTFIGITKDRAAAFDFGPVLIGLRTTFLVPASSTIQSIPEIDQAGVRIVVPARSAQGEHLEKIISKATMLRVPVETTKPATDMIAAGQADAFSHVVPMLAQAQPALSGSRILPGSYYDVPIAIAYPKGAPAAVVELGRNFVADMKGSGFAQKAIDRMGKLADGVVVAAP
jgi:polar amino acid transport system substrate-binding protein